jgi:hypothetical protein
VNGLGQRLRWHASGSTDQAAIRAAQIVVMPTEWDDLTLVGFDTKPHNNSGWWDCTADYAFSPEQAGGVKAIAEPELDDPLGPEIEFDISAQQVHITQSVRTVTSRFDSTRGGIGAPSWAASTAYTVGQSVSNGANVYVVTTAGTSASSGGPTGTGTGITDGSVTWNFVGTTAANTVVVWVADTVYNVGDRVDSHGYLYECTTGGTSATDTDGPEGSGTGITDGSAVWDYVGPDLDPKAPDYGQAIGCTRDRVTGTDVFVGAFDFSITAQYYPVTLRLLETLLNLVGTFNGETWWNFPPKTLLYMGCTGVARPGNIWTLKHRFSASKNLRNVPVGANIELPFKGGHDFLWAAYTDMTKQFGGKNFTMQVPFAAYVEQVYQPGDFTTLPI